MAAGNTPTVEGTGVTSSVVSLTRMRWLRRGGKQVIDDVEALLAGRVVDAADIDRHLELAARVIAQEGQHLDDPVARDVERVKLAMGNARAADDVPQGTLGVLGQLL